MTRRELLGSTLSAADRETRLRMEEDNVIQCLNYARDKLGMGANPA